MRGRAPRISLRCATRIRNWSRHERRATPIRFSRNRPADPGDRTGVYLRVGHGQDQRDRSHASDFSRLVRWLFDCLQPHGIDDRRHRLAGHQGRRHLGHQHPHRLGFCDRQFCVVDRHWSRRHFNLRHFVSVESEVAHLHQPICGMLSMGWRGSARHWHRYQSAYLLLAGLATPLVLSVHSVISFDFSVSIVPGWHTTIFPPYFVAGAIYSGFAMVLTIAIPLRKAYGLEDFITMRHLDNMAKVMLATGLIVAYGYFIEFFMALYSGNKFDVFLVQQRLHGPYAPFYYALLLCNILTPQLLWFYKMRHNVAVLFIMSIVVNIGMWLERFVIVVISLTRDFVPSAWGRYSPTFWDWATFIGTMGLFVMLIFLFVRVLPATSIAEMRELVAETSEEEK